MNKENLKTFTPETGMVVYRRDSKFYVQVHEIIKTGDNKFTWGEGKPFQKEQLQDLALSIKKENFSSLKLKYFLPENVLYYQPGIINKFMWFIEPQKCGIVFAPELKLKSGYFKMPGLIMAVSGDDLTIFAYKGKLRPTQKTELFNAPFYNIYEDGKVCMGTISEARKRHYLHEEIDRWDRRFFGGRFTSAHGNDNKLSEPFTFKTLYKFLATGKPFPERALKPAAKKTLGTFFSSFLGKEKNEN